MVQSDKLDNALHALQGVLVIARSMAYDGAPYEALARVLDTAEYLPSLIWDATDRTETFRTHLVGLASEFPRMRLAVNRFDSPDGVPRSLSSSHGGGAPSS